MRINVLTLSLCFLTAKGSSQNILLDNIWLTQDKEAKIKFYAEKGKIYGKIIWLRKPYDQNGKPARDMNNADTMLRNRELTGLVILKDFEFKDNEWSNGTLYDPTDGNTYKSKMWLEDDNILKIRGYLGLLYETETWTRSQ